DQSAVIVLEFVGLARPASQPVDVKHCEYVDAEPTASRQQKRDENRKRRMQEGRQGREWRKQQGGQEQGETGGHAAAINVTQSCSQQRKDHRDERIPTGRS